MKRCAWKCVLTVCLQNQGSTWTQPWSLLRQGSFWPLIRWSPPVIYLLVSPPQKKSFFSPTCLFAPHLSFSHSVAVGDVARQQISSFLSRSKMQTLTLWVQKKKKSLRWRKYLKHTLAHVRAHTHTLFSQSVQQVLLSQVRPLADRKLRMRDEQHVPPQP